MLSIDINHPDSPDFIISKQNLTKITGANISVRLNNEFMKAVENDEDYILRWPCNENPKTILEIDSLEYNKLEEYSWADDSTNGQIKKGYCKKIKAKELWDSIIQCAWNTAEPGILFWDNIIDNDPAGVYDIFRATSTNPCGEIPLSPYDSCRLIAVNVYSLIEQPFTPEAYLNIKKAQQVFYEAQIIGDILVDLELEYIQNLINNTEGNEKLLWEKVFNIGNLGRRTGVGILGLGDYFAALNVPYGDEKYLKILMNLKQSSELNASIDLSILNNPFPEYNFNLEYEFISDGVNQYLKGKNKFFEHLYKHFPQLVEKMAIYGRRNVSWSTIAPTGSISILAGTTSGCEPVFSLYYTRRKKCNPGETPDFIDQNGVGFKNFNVVHPKLQIWWKEYNRKLQTFPENFDLQSTDKNTLDNIIKESPWYGNTAGDLTPELRVKTQSILQEYITHSISSTVNVNNDVTPEFIKDIYENAWKQNLKGITVYRDGCRSGILVKEEKLKENISLPKVRPAELFCKVEQFKNEKKEWLAIIGLLEGKPYEIFTGPKDIDVFPIPSSVTEGTIIKVRQEDGTSRYDFRYVDSYGYTNTLGGLSRVFDKEFWNYGRLVSGYLRSHIPIEQIIKIVDGLTFTNKGMNNWKSGVIRSLKSFIEDGTSVIGETCENCGSSNIVYENGCKTCRDCLTSRCS